MGSFRVVKRPASALQEADGATSMRRVLAIINAVAQIGLLFISATRDSRWGFWAGFVCGLFSIMLLGMTTIEEITRLVRATASVVRGSRQDTSDGTTWTEKQYAGESSIVDPGK